MNVDDGPADERDARLQALVAELVAELASAAYRIALQHGARAVWVDLELDLWRALMEAVNRWELAEHIERPEYSDGVVARRRLTEDAPAHIVGRRGLSADCSRLVGGG